jgi:arylsulfatase A-like enzyme
MNRRDFLGASASAALAAQPTRDRPPNIIFIFSDNLGYGDLGCYGSIIRTPNIDRLAAEGVRFRHGYTASPICSPARAAFFTGRYPPRAGLPGLVFSDSTFALPASQVLLSQVLKQAGYKTACIGKWHLGHAKPEYMPHRRGFDRYYGLPYSADMTPLPLYDGDKVIEEPARLELLTRRFTNQAVDFIEKSKESPFFLYLPYVAPHPPQAASDRFRGKSPAGIYGDMVEEMDWGVGEIVSTLEKHGLTRNTLVIFASDNGPMNLGSAGPLRGEIGSAFEGGVRVPFIARFTGHIPGGRVSDAIVCMMDLFPTFVRLANAPKQSQKLDGIDIWPVLSGAEKESRRDILLYFDNVHIQCARMGRLKLHLSRYNIPGSHPRPGRINQPLNPLELYDVVQDPNEAYDIAPEHPREIEKIQARVEQLVRDMPPDVQKAYAETKAMKVPRRRWPGLKRDPLEPQ